MRFCSNTLETTDSGIPLRQFLLFSSKDIRARSAAGVQFDTHLMPNPGNTREWIVLFKKDAGTSYFLIDEQDEVECFADLNGLIEELRQLGIKGAEIHL